MLFLRCVLGSAKNTDTGFVIFWTVHQPIHVRYIGPDLAKHLYLLRLHDSLEIMLLKFGGEAINTRQPTIPNSTYKSMFGYQVTCVCTIAPSLCALALQRGPICTIVEKPWQYSIVEPGCALWRVSHCVLAEAGTVCQEPLANVCHLTLGRLPVLIVGGKLEDWCLSICPSSAQAVYPRTQSAIWAPEHCVLLIYQITYVETESYERIATLSPDQQKPSLSLPPETAVCQAAEQLHVEACIDACQQTS